MLIEVMFGIKIVADKLVIDASYDLIGLPVR
jgi:hypothetical protein